ncbi:hypothetical protein [uncultured Dokdonia sp.]
MSCSYCNTLYLIRRLNR